MIIATRLLWDIVYSARRNDNMFQLLRFSVYFEGILNTNNGYFHIKIMISAVHMLGARGHVQNFFGKKMQFGAF